MLEKEQLLARIRGEYREMPGLRLTLEQACRLWQLDDSTCRHLLEHLVRDRSLFRAHDGTYAVLPSMRSKPVRADLPVARRRRVHHG